MTVRVGVIGVGMIGQDHIRRITQVLTGGAVAAVTDVDAARADSVAAGLAGATVHPTGMDLIGDPDVDAVLVTSWGPTHEEHVLGAIEAGKPVFCEKPLATSKEACLRIIDAEMARGRRLVQVGFMRRYDAGYRALKAALSDGRIGPPLLMHCVHRNPSAPPYGFTTEGMITDSAVHEIDLVQWLFGEPIVAASVLKPRRSGQAAEGLHDPLIVLLEMASGVLVDVEVFVNATYGYDIRGEIVGETGAVALAEAVAEVTVKSDGGCSSRVPADWRDRFARAFDAELQAWLNAVAAGTSTGPGSWDGYAAAVVTDGCLEALRTGQRTPVSLAGRPPLLRETWRDARVTGRVGIGLAGLGRMGRIHAANLSGRCPSARLACVFDTDSGAARHAGERFEVPWVSSYDDMLAGDLVDAVAIATPTATHAELSVRAARAGKHVFCEKPISLERPAAVSAVEQVRAAGVVFQVGFHRRFDPDWAAAVDRIRAGELGEVYLFRTSLRDMTPPKAEFLARSGGFFVDVTIHDLDVARWMVGEITQVSAYGTALSDPEFAEIGDIDTAVVVLRFAGGALGVIDNSRAAGYGYECSTEVLGRQATVRIDHPQYRHYEWRTPGWAARGLPRDFEQRYPDAYAEELESFARCAAGGLPPRVTAYDALAAFDLARAADLSWRRGRPVRVEPRRVGPDVVYTVHPPAQ